MSFEYWLESDLKLGRENIRDISYQLGIEVSACGEDIELYFNSSNMIVRCKFPNETEDQIKSEETGGLEFKVGCRCVFELNTEQYEQKMNDMECFLKSVYNQTQALFVVSFQLESLHYLNNGNGVEKRI